MPIELTAALLVSQLLLQPAADRVPQMSMEPTCRAAVAVNVQPRPDVATCLRSEQRAKETLRAQWKGFTSADRQRCITTATMAGDPSYVQLLTCLETARDVRKLPADSSPPFRSISR